MSDYALVRGTYDLLPDEFSRFIYVTNKAREIFSRYDFKEILVPIIEKTGLFTENLGELSNIVNKEMYSFEDNSGRKITLRPELTASIIRCFSNNNFSSGSRLFSIGPVFRYERPQKCRYRQFYQISCEIIGSDSMYDDLDIVAASCRFLDEIGLLQDLTLEINSVGDKITREHYSNGLRQYLLQYQDELSIESKGRLFKNTLRILDSKDSGDRRVLENAPKIQDFLTYNAKKSFDDFMKYLDSFGIKYVVNPLLVRGLDYYCNTVFEFTTDELGSQNAVLAGGRYYFNGNNLGGVGFAVGLERILALRIFSVENIKSIGVISVGDVNKDIAFVVVEEIRRCGIKAMMIAGGNINKQLNIAHKRKCSFVLLIGEDEIANKQYTFKNMDSGEQYKIPMTKDFISEIIKFFE